MPRILKGSHEASFEPNVNFVYLIQQYRMFDHDVRLPAIARVIEDDPEFGQAFRTEYAFSVMRVNRWWLSREIARTHVGYIILLMRIKLPRDIVRKIWVDFIVKPFGHYRLIK